MATDAVVSKDRLEEALARDWVGAKDAGRLLDRTTQLVWLLGKQGKIATLQTPGGMLYSRADIERIVAAREVGR